MKNFIAKGMAVSLLLVSSIAQAVPTLFFDGDINYTASDGALNVTSDITGVQDLSISLDSILTSTITTYGNINFSAIFDSIATEANFFSTTIIGSFKTNPSIEDISATDIYGNTLFTGNFNSIELSGSAGVDSGRVEGVINTTITSGSLAAEFGIGTVVALEFNLTSNFNTATFSTTMFNSDFSGGIDGNITGESISVAEPSIVALLGLGVLFTGIANSKKRHTLA